MENAGIRSNRMLFPCDFFEQWGYNILYDNDSFKSAKQGGQSNFTAFITFKQNDGGFVPSDIYQDIWVSGQPGTVNPGNSFALCVSKMVKTYKADVKIYEVYNEPDWVANWQDTLTWNVSAPTNSQLARFDGDIYTYNRLLRIVWEVAKYFDPTCFIAPGGLGYTTFLDAILRYTDSASNTNPSNTGRNYIDAMSTHFYPIYATNKNNSDQYMKAYQNHQNAFQQVCKKYNFNPSIWIVTEVGVSTQTIGGYYGSDLIARNFFLKLPSYSVKSGVRQNHIFVLSDDNGSSDAHSRMGLYFDYANKPTATIKESTKALKTWDYHLFDKTLDQAKTIEFQSKLPSGVIVFAYSNSTSTCYLIWSDSSNYDKDDNTPSINCPIQSTGYFKQYDYLNNYSTLELLDDSVTIVTTSTPLFIYQTDSPNPSTSSTLRQSSIVAYLFCILFIQLFILLL
ncbi:hypothetical protein DLAC_09040 [Tieghemostelium lacteum]|uniref:Glycoside hydrolase family 5 domain-containing protein n=1 Tax=Tieghemostelium lacteum TaxID=361077 RepID=A0A151Z8Z7_TIELA|nr:hypothetical protein DLAC_09040 [Tieghemostelium lacteum]|eukprot:KYQ90421.1 hypothetical protein DLAC_09040 [Tieghemostelium lacteum]